MDVDTQQFERLAAALAKQESLSPMNDKDFPKNWTDAKSEAWQLARSEVIGAASCLVELTRIAQKVADNG